MLIGDFRDKIASLTASALPNSQAGDVPQVDIPKDPAHGDFSTNVAMILAKSLRKKPREIAEGIVQRIGQTNDLLAGAPVIEGPGFINFRVSDRAWRGVIEEVIEKGENYGRSDIGAGEKVLVEFVSANPTGPLHIGHARGAAIGDSMARVLKFSGHDVTKEFYINDAGAQVDILAKSVHARWLELCNIKVDWENFGDYYPGEYVRDIAKYFSPQMFINTEELKKIPAGAFHKSERENAIQVIQNSIGNDLDDFKVEYDSWFYESKLYETNATEMALKQLQTQGDIFEKDGAVWFKVSKYQPDEEDRVIRKSSGEWTYFASDITYHRNKLERGFQRLINVWGADHHGYIGRVKAALQALGFPPERLQVLLVQMVNLVRNGEPVRMGKRTGEFITLRDVLDEVGSDAMRFTFLTRGPNSHLDFDVDALKIKPGEDSEVKMSQLREKNPVYYVQYAFARHKAIFRKAQEEGINQDSVYVADLDLLTKPEEIELAKKMERFPREVAQAAVDAEPHRLSHYLLDLAGDFHRYYYMGDKDKSYRVISEDRKVAQARLALVAAVGWVVRNGLELLGVTAPDRM